MATKRENLLNKIEALEKKAAESRAELDEKKAELLELDKNELYQAVMKSGLTTAEVIEMISTSNTQDGQTDLPGNIKKENVTSLSQKSKEVESDEDK